MIRTLLLLMPDSARHRVPGYVALSVVSVALRAAGAVALVPLIAALFSPEPAAALPWLGVLAVCTVGGWAVDALVNRIGFDLGFTLLDHAQKEMADRIARIPLTWFSSTRTASARQAIAATGPELVGLVTYLITPLFQAVLLPVALGVALLAVAPTMGVAALVGVPVLWGAMWLSGRSTRGADRIHEAANTELSERLLEFARSQQALRSARRVETRRSHAGAALRAQHGAAVRVLLLQIPGHLLFGLATQIALVLLAGTATVLAVRGEIGVPEAIGLIVVIARYLEPFASLGTLTPAIENTGLTLRHIREVLEAPVPAGEDQEPRALPTGPAGVALDRIVVRHSDDAEPVIDGLSVEFAPGRTTAVVGPSGAGKSTLLAVIAGLHEPASGTVRIGGTDTSELDTAARRALTSVVFQHPYLFSGTIRENVLAGDPGASEERLRRVLRLARVDEIVERLPDGLDTTVGEGGSTVSGGERQRISIARALLKAAPVLLIDEATSALDTENEAAVVDALGTDPLVEGVQQTRIVVAHRLSTIRRADRVLFLEEGRIVEDGTVPELIAASGRFAEFWRHQHEATGWQLSAG